MFYVHPKKENPQQLTPQEIHKIAEENKLQGLEKAAEISYECPIESC